MFTEHPLTVGHSLFRALHTQQTTSRSGCWEGGFGRLQFLGALFCLACLTGLSF